MKKSDRNLPKWLFCVDNVYRTKNYIVAQVLTKAKKGSATYMLSEDIFYKRTPNRDRQFDIYFSDNTYADGKRIISTLSTRKYID